jgi:hypothetical protein
MEIIKMKWFRSIARLFQKSADSYMSFDDITRELRPRPPGTPCPLVDFQYFPQYDVNTDRKSAIMIYRDYAVQVPEIPDKEVVGKDPNSIVEFYDTCLDTYLAQPRAVVNLPTQRELEQNAALKSAYEQMMVIWRLAK